MVCKEFVNVDPQFAYTHYSQDEQPSSCLADESFLSFVSMRMEFLLNCPVARQHERPNVLMMAMIVWS